MIAARTLLGGVLGGLLVIALLPAVGRAVAADGWRLTASPRSVPLLETRNVTLKLTDTDGSGDIGCLILRIPSQMSVVDSWIVDTTVDDEWETNEHGNSPRVVEVYNPDGNGKLKENDSVEFVVRVQGMVAGHHSWTGDVLQNNDCGGDPFLDRITIDFDVPEAGATPTPTPTPTHTNAHPHADSDSNSNSNSDFVAYAVAVAYADRDATTYRNAYATTDAYADRDECGYTDTDCVDEPDGQPDPVTVVFGDPQRRSDTERDSDSLTDGAGRAADPAAAAGRAGLRGTR